MQTVGAVSWKYIVQNKVGLMIIFDQTRLKKTEEHLTSMIFVLTIICTLAFSFTKAYNV